VFSWLAREAVKTAVGMRRDFFDRPTLTLKNFELHATTVEVGLASHAPHQHPDEELVLVKEGRLEVTINGTVSWAEAGSVIFFASNDLHGMRNGGDAPVTYHVIRWISTETPQAT
jgi:XRE family transcriptional regulator, regulator of sulfur utilization